MSKSLDPDQNRRSVGPDLGPNCLQRLIFHAFVGLCRLFSKLTFSKNSFRNTIVDQVKRFVGHDLSANCLSRLSADDH